MSNKFFLRILLYIPSFLYAMESAEDKKLTNMINELAVIRKIYPEQLSKFQQETKEVAKHYTLLLYAIKTYNRVEVFAAVKIFVEKYNANVNAADYRGITPLINTAGQGYIEVVRYLLEHEADVNAQSFDNVHLAKEDTALMRAARQNFKDIVQCLLEYGADKTMQNAAKRTALDIARINNATDVIPLLENQQNH